MRMLILILVLFASCKKKEVTPTPVPEPCKTGDVFFTGKYHNGFGSTDTIYITFQRNNCPTTQSNIYLVKNFAAIANKALGQNTYAAGDYTIVTNEPNRTAVGTDATFSLDDRATNTNTLLTAIVNYTTGGHKTMTFIKAK